jgi:NADP-dependent 3-hydroxy acid dehydrogenase YdfG
MSDAPLNNQIALITGASSGIGQAIAEAFVRAGAHLVVVARREERLRALADMAEQAGRQCQVVVGDVRQPETAQQAVDAAFTRFGQLDILVNNAGIGRYGDLVQSSIDDYDAMMDTNMRSTFLFTHTAVPRLIQQKRGTIIVISSMAGVMGFPGEAIYCSTKFAQVGFALALERELRPRGIRVGVVMPGGVKTEFAIGTGRTEEGVAASGMLEAQDVAAATLLMATQPAHSRIIEIRMRPMVEPLYGREQD